MFLSCGFFKPILLLGQFLLLWGFVSATKREMKLRLDSYLEYHFACQLNGSGGTQIKSKSKDEIERNIVDEFECIINAIIVVHDKMFLWKFTSCSFENLLGLSSGDLSRKYLSTFLTNKAKKMFFDSVFKGCANSTERFEEYLNLLLSNRSWICEAQNILASDTEEVLKGFKRFDRATGVLFSNYMIKEKKHSEDLKSLLRQRGKFIEADEIVQRIEKEVVNIGACFDEITVDSVQWFKMAVSFIEKYNNSSSLSQDELTQFKNLSLSLDSKYQYKAELEKKVEEWLDVVAIAAYPHERPIFYSQ